jgi:hypothetical protein
MLFNLLKQEYTYITIYFRLLIGINKKSHNAQDLEHILSAFAVISCHSILTITLVKNLIQLVKTVHVKDLCLCQQDQKNVECIGLYDEKILMLIHGGHLASKNNDN